MQMGFIRSNLRTVAFLAMLWAWDCEAQSLGASAALARQLDSFLQDYAYRAFVRPRTGIPYDGVLPSNFSGVKIAVIRLKSGSLRARGVHSYNEFDIPDGVHSYNEFDIPDGVISHPYVKRLAFVYQNLGKLSSYYYPLPGYTYLSPVLGLLAYGAANLSATNLRELDIVASSSPISIRFTDVRPVPVGLTAKCVWFSLNGSSKFSDLVTNGICSTFHQGHFSIVVEGSPAPAPAPAPVLGPAVVPSSGRVPGKGQKSNMWKIVVSVVCGFVGLLLLSLLTAWLISYRKKKKLIQMQKREDAGEFLQICQVGNTRLPVAPMTRTQPLIESDYML